MALNDITHVAVSSLLQSSMATLYTVPAKVCVIFCEINEVNTSTSTSYTSELQIVDDAGSDADKWVVAKQASLNPLQPGERRPYNYNPMIPTLALIRGKASTADKIACRISMTLKQVVA